VPVGHVDFNFRIRIQMLYKIFTAQPSAVESYWKRIATT
jgi:hypothetical protein